MIAAARSELPAIRAESEAHDDAGVTSQSAQRFPGLRIPDPDRGIFTGSGEPAILPIQRNSPDLSSVSSESFEFLAARGVPNLHGVSFSPGNQPLTVGAESCAFAVTGG